MTKAMARMSAFGGYDDCIAKCPLMTQNEHGSHFHSASLSRYDTVKGGSKPASKPFLRNTLNGVVGPPKLALGPVAHRVDYGDPRDSCCCDGFRVGEDPRPTGNPLP